MFNILLKDVTVDHLIGSWDIVRQQAGSVSPDDLLNGITRITFYEDRRVLIDEKIFGTYEFVKVSKHIFSPQVLFEFPDYSIKSILTRLVSDLKNNDQFTMVLYFSHGLQLTAVYRT